VAAVERPPRLVFSASTTAVDTCVVSKPDIYVVCVAVVIVASLVGQEEMSACMISLVVSQHVLVVKQKQAPDRPGL